MFGIVGLSGVIINGGLVMIDFMHEAVRENKSHREAILYAAKGRFRPIFLTAGTAMLAAWPITLDPIFSGLGWSLIFGLAASTIFTLFVIPATYWLLKAKPNAPE